MLRTNLLRTTAFAGVLAFASTGAIAQTVVAGGATRPAPVYQLEFGEIHTVNTGLTYDYHGVGSGGGQTGFLNNDATQFGLAAGTSVAFGASDAALSAAQVAGYTRAGIDGALIQLPILGTAVAVAFPPNVVGKLKVTVPGTTKGKATFTPFTAGQNGKITLTDDDLCGIFSGKITDWSNISTTGIGTLPAVTSGTGVVAPVSPITVAVRSDSSGTTFLFTQHLAAVCTATNTAAGVTFTTGKVFASNFPGGTLPGNIHSYSGNGAVVAALEAQTNGVNIGYASPDYTSIATASASTHHTLLVAKVKNATSGTAYLPNAGGTKAGLAGVTAATYAVKDAATGANPLNWVPLIPTPDKGYPIVGYTNGLFAQCYSNASVAAAVKLFINGNTSTAAVPSFISGVAPDGTAVADNGFVPVSSAITKLIAAHIVANTGKAAKGATPATYWNLDIGNATVCAGKAGR